MEAPALVFRPGPEPTHDDAEGGRRWHYLTADGEKLDPPSYIYESVCGGFSGECDNFIYPDGYSPPGPATRSHVETRIEERLREMRIRVAARPGPAIEA